MIQAKVTPQEMIGKLTQMGLSEEQAISAVKMVASKLNGGQEQPEKMENGDAIQPAPGYEFSQRSVDANASGLPRHFNHTTYARSFYQIVC